ncbi:amylo-alpha-1,6-glucosidase [Planctomicrobium sp. SH664]|uniref:amylo-alpha-1,6-glucosidase n=1 Tax=Planctomicrobium sp. SH664 TaxID=3448125 RepID=UPI003F5CA5BB
MTRDEQEWLETDGLGGFASGTVSGRRSRRYHALLLTARHPPADRLVLINGFEASVTTAAGTCAISSQHYVPDVIHPHGDRHLVSFTSTPWPTWVYDLPNGAVIRCELFIPHGRSALVLRWSLVEEVVDSASLNVRFLHSGRDYHALHRENSLFSFEPQRLNNALLFRPYPDVPGALIETNGSYQQEPLWYRQFCYALEAERGLDFVEDLASPGSFRFDLQRGPALCLLTAEGPDSFSVSPGERLDEVIRELETAERSRRAAFKSPLHFAADQYLVKRGEGLTIVAGYPWFLDWGRDTFLSLRGLCLATGRVQAAGQILREWSTQVSGGMLPNRFPDQGTEPEYNSVDAALWFIIAVNDFLLAAGTDCSPTEREQLLAAVDAILEGYSHGTRYQIGADHDGLLKAGEPGVQLTWMDAKVGDWVVTPRIGKPVEIQALWINALRIGAQSNDRWKRPFQLASTSFRVRFWNPAQQCLFDVIDSDHRPGAVDASIRPNQILAVGGLPYGLLDDQQARQVVDIVEQKLLTPCGPRTLDPDSPAYHPHYTGGVRERDEAYHQGTVWPWLIGPFVEAWLRVHQEDPHARATARQRFLQPLLETTTQFGLGHVCEIADGEPTAFPEGPRQRLRGCPFQAWSVGELLRVLKLLDEPAPTPTAN